jgi:glycosyltransferase involved in cell wall biosynthesis
MDAPLVSVICLCYNHARFVEESMESVMRQTHARVQMIVVDDASTDESRKVIEAVMRHYPEVAFVPLEENHGNCRAFNRGFTLAKGDYIIDLAADDALMPNRIEEGVKAFQKVGATYGVNFTDAELVNEFDGHLGFHSDRFPHATIPEGDIYKEVIRRYFINGPTMMIRRSVLEKLGGYDESLAYEDFDFWIRSSRHFNYCYTPLPLVRRRILSDSMARNQYRINSPQLVSTFIVCEKIARLNKTPAEDKALRRRILYEGRRALRLGAFGLAIRYSKLMFNL